MNPSQSPKHDMNMEKWKEKDFEQKEQAMWAAVHW